MEAAFERNTFGKRLSSMLAVDVRRMLRSRLFYILIAASLLIPILILVMTTMMDGTVTVDPQTGKETVIEGFDNVWQIIGSVSTPDAAASASMDMSMTAMCNINLLYFGIAVLVCLFVSEEFRSGYAKNLFAVRAKKGDYVISKTLVCCLGGACMILAFFVGSLVGGAVAGLPFTMDGFGVFELVMCLLSKVALVAIFVPIYLCMSVIGKQRTWLSMLLSMGVAMLLFNVAPMVSPLNASIVHVLLCLAGGGLFCLGLGAISRLVLTKTALV